MGVGGGCQQASLEITQLAELLNVGVIASNAGKGVVSDVNPLSLGGGIISPAVQDYLSEADVVLAIGTELGEADSFIYNLPVNGKLIRIDIDSARFSDAFPADIAIHGDACIACTQLIEALDGLKIGTASSDTIAVLEKGRARQFVDYTSVERQHL